MPLKSGKGNVGVNIKTEIAAGKPQKQAVAITLDELSKGLTPIGSQTPMALKPQPKLSQRTSTHGKATGQF